MVALLSAACSKPGNGGDDPQGFDRKAVLAGVADNAILPIYERVVTAAVGLESATAAYAADPTSTTARDEARAAWRDVMAMWQQAEVFQVGPAGQSSKVIDGRNLRDEIYSWPTSNTCRVDQEIVANGFEAPSYFDGKLVNSYGLDAIEYLLFYDSPENTCSPVLGINSEGQWDAIAGEVDARRAALARVMATKVVADATQLRDAWATDGFADAFARPGDDDSPYRSEREALNDLFAAMFYLELTTKDKKLATPLGLHPDCTTEVCPETLEFRFADFSRAAVHANLQGFLAGLTAGEGVGFDDYLRASNAGDLADQMVADAEAAIAAAAGDPDLRTMLQSNPNEAMPIHAAVKKVTDELKSRFVSVLNLDVPQEGAGDND